jgi:hypothetical protein
MEPTRAADCRLTPDAAEFVRFCYRRRMVGWPELYDEMCAVASRGLFRGWGPSELAEHGVGFGLFELPALAALTVRVVAEEQADRRSAAVASRAVERGAVEPDPPAPSPTAGPDSPAMEGAALVRLVPLAS